MTNPAQLTPRAGHFVLLASMFLAVFLTVTAIMAPGPLLLDISRDLGITVPVAGQLVTVAATTWAVIAIVAGPFSDTYGRRPVLVIGTCLLGVGSLGIGVAPGYGTAVAFSLLIGIGGGMVPPTCIAVAGDTFADNRRPMAIAIVTTAPVAAGIAGVPLSAVLAEYAGWRAPFLWLGAALLLTALILFLVLPHLRDPAVRLNLGGRLMRIASVPLTWSIAGTNLLARLIWGAVLTFFAPFLMLTYDLGTADVALPMAIVAAWGLVAPSLGGYIGGRANRLAMTTGTLFLAIIPAAGTFVLDWGVWPSVLVAGLLMLLILPVTTVLSILFAETGHDSRGALAGVISCTNWAGTALGAGLGGILVAQIGYGAISALLVTVIFGSAVMMALFVSRSAIARAHAHFSRGAGQKRDA